MTIAKSERTRIGGEAFKQKNVQRASDKKRRSAQSKRKAKKSPQVSFSNFV